MTDELEYAQKEAATLGRMVHELMLFAKWLKTQPDLPEEVIQKLDATMVRILIMK